MVVIQHPHRARRFRALAAAVSGVGLIAAPLAAPAFAAPAQELQVSSAQGEAKVTTWLYRVVANACTDRLRKRRTVDIDSVAEPEDGAPSAADRIQDRARADALQGALDSLPERQRQAVVLRHIEGFSNPEIAQIMDVKVEAVESLTARGKRALKTALEGRKDELGYDND